MILGRINDFCYLLYWASVVLVLFTAATANAQCVPPKPADSELFLTSPQSGSSLTKCQQYSASTCCAPAYAAQVASGTDRVHANLVNGVLSNVDAHCGNLFDELACVFCAPTTDEFLTRLPTAMGYQVTICVAFCDRLLAACANATLTDSGNTVGSQFSSGKDFCMSEPFYLPFYPDIVADAPTCFNPEIPLCTSDDYYGYYTACVNNRHDYIYQWKLVDGRPTCSGGVYLPSNKYNIPCDIACQPGYYLPGGASACAQCPAGTFSIGGGVAISYWDPTMPEWPAADDNSYSFSTYCQDITSGESGNCNGWTKYGDYLASGENIDNHNTESVLELDVVLVEPGNISFSVRVDSEVGFDGLRFEIGPNEHHLIPVGGEFKTYTFPLSRGPHNLRWVYFKDFLWSVGDDMAFITWIEIDGTHFADAACTTCPQGTYNNAPGQRRCEQCGFNRIPTIPPVDCEPCSDDKFAIPGDYSCSPRPACTVDDYEPVYTNCHSPGVRELNYQWIQPQLCMDINSVLPASQSNLPCEPCSPGMYRTGNYKCAYCAEGRTSPGGNATSCTQCPFNTAAVKGKIYTTFDGDWPQGWATGCDQCDTGGYRRHHDHLDSGDGESLFFSWLSITEEYVVDGSFGFQAVIDCPLSDCSLSFWVDDLLVNNWYSSGDHNMTINITQPTTAGNHTVYLDFARWIPVEVVHSHNNTKVSIWNITMIGTTSGGAPSCVPCPTGSVSGPGSTTCTACSPGSYPNSQGYCVSCPVNTITDRPGMSACIPCGAGTSTNGKVGQTECELINGCVFNAAIEPGWNVTFNLTALAKYDSMWGPIYDPVNRQSYWLNVCTKDHANSTCLNADNTTMETFACQITGQGASKDLGRMLGFSYNPPADLSEESVVLTYTYGKQCEQDTWDRREVAYEQPMRHTRKSKAGMQALRAMYTNRELLEASIATAVARQDSDDPRRPYRSTNLTIICDPTAGLGYPQAPPDGIEDLWRLCRYDFVWYSIYGCHICSEKDYDYRYTACENGMRTKVYYWKYSPRRCIGGVSVLPPEQTESCTPSTTICADGQYVSPHGSNCTACPPGNYSIGGGELTEWWGSKLRGYTIYCESRKGAVQPGCNGSWVPEGRTITTRGNIHDISVLSAERNFIQRGSVSFDFTLFTENQEPFVFLMDDRPIASWNHTTINGRTTFNLTDVSKGTHIFKWKFSPFTSDEKPRMAMIWSVTFRNTQYSEAFCNPCEGTLVQERPGASSCYVCPANSVYVSPTQCERCAQDEFALPGDSVCRSMHPCTASDYYEVFTPCYNGNRTTYWMPILPKICSGEADLSTRTVACSCPRGYYLNGDVCATCPSGKYWDSNSNTCATAGPGHAVVRVREWLTSAQDTTITMSYPTQTKRDAEDHVWATGCVGDCGSLGWRVLGNKIDSGAHFDAAVSWTSFYSTLEQDGEIRFMVDVSSHGQVTPEVSLEFYIDDRVIDIPRQSALQTVTVPVTAGRHLFLWIHRQTSQAINGDQNSEISDVVVVGTTEGGSLKAICPAGYMGAGNTAACVPCAPGYFSATSGQTTCYPCANGTFSSSVASKSCTPCGYGTKPNKEKAATACTTSCIFDANTTGVTYTFDLSSLSRYPPLISDNTDRLGKKFTMQLCDKMNAAQQINRCNQPTYICEEEPSLHEAVSAGDLLTFVPLPDTQVATGFSLEYSHGVSDNCPNARKSIVHMQCRLGATPYTVFKFDFEHHEANSRMCEYHFIMETEYACPRCIPSDIVVINGECVEGKRQIKYESKVDCLGLNSTEIVPCSNVEVNEFAILVIAAAVVAVFVGLLAMAIFFWNKKRQLAQRYDLLIAEQQSPLEMQAMDRGDLEEDSRS